MQDCDLISRRQAAKHTLAKTRSAGAGMPEFGLLSAYVSGKTPNQEQMCPGRAWVSAVEGSGGARIRLVNVTSGVMRAWKLGYLAADARAQPSFQPLCYHHVFRSTGRALLGRTCVPHVLVCFLGFTYQ